MTLSQVFSEEVTDKLTFSLLAQLCEKALPCKLGFEDRMLKVMAADPSNTWCRTGTRIRCDA